MRLPTGNPALDAYLEKGYSSVRGMSSVFAASISGHMIRRQTELGIRGHIAEIGTFEGRFFIALAHGLAAGEHAIGIDIFTWPSEKVLENLHANLAHHGIEANRYTAIKGSTADMEPADVIAPAKVKADGSLPIRFFHIDGQHDEPNLVKDLSLALPLMHRQGLIVLDDMLHPSYPGLVETVHKWLRAHPEWVCLAIIDREDIVAAAKYVLVREEALHLYEQDLLTTFAGNVFPMGSDVEGHFTVVLTPHPRLAEVD
ncbi:MAG: class I SAM-dependent methyltransferase [Beijerinckiaceae bacterium]|nr:class I SAM-dependent methyltransferase [Beijerinckiaceae bacterium]